LSGSVRRETQPYRPDRPSVPQLAAGTVLRDSDSGEILILYEKAEERWCLPKGHVEPGESLAQTARRETEEETGITEFALGNEVGEVSYRFFDPRKDSNVFKTTVYFDAATRQRRANPESMFTEFRWTDRAAAMQLVAYESDRRIIAGASPATGPGSSA
jgi:8-oxo-dGTP pyrophosphatase MutT (NUDIX family)